MVNPEHRCPHCKHPVPEGAKYCGQCGRAEGSFRRQALRSQKQENQQHSRAVTSMALVYTLVLAGLILVLLLSIYLGVEDENSWQYLAMQGFWDLAVGCIGLWVLGQAAWRRSFAGGASAKALLLAIVLVPMAIAFSYGYVELWNSWLGMDEESVVIPLGLGVVISTAVYPALVEEWLCRGVLWEAARRILSPWRVIVATALLFAMMHGLGGGFVLELPHRFVVGLLLGWLRLKTGSLLPCIFAHFGHNLFFLWLEG